MHRKTDDRTNRRTRELVEAGNRYYLPVYEPRHVVFDHGAGARLFDVEGNDYVDLGAGIGVNVLGHAHPELVEALRAQSGRLWHTSNIYFSEPVVMLARELVASSEFASRVFFCNSGAEANEAAIKLVRKWAAERGRTPQERDIITFEGSFHGRTLATLAATGQPKYQQGFEPLPEGFVRSAPFNDRDALSNLVSSRTAAIMLEPIQGEGGIVPAEPGFLTFVRDLCDRCDALLVLDEIQCGMGRTGKLWGYMWEEGVQPDILTCAKALGGGIPIGAMLTGDRAAHAMQFGSHGSTFGGNPMACAAARVVLRHVRDPALMQNVTARGEELRRALESIGAGYDLFDQVRGRGLMIGAGLKAPWRGRSKDLMATARKHGVLVLQAGPDVLRFLPPLNITPEELDDGLARLKAAVAEFVGRT